MNSKTCIASSGIVSEDPDKIQEDNVSVHQRYDYTVTVFGAHVVQYIRRRDNACCRPSVTYSVCTPCYILVPREHIVQVLVSGKPMCVTTYLLAFS